MKNGLVEHLDVATAKIIDRPVEMAGTDGAWVRMDVPNPTRDAHDGLRSASMDIPMESGPDRS